MPHPGLSGYFGEQNYPYITPKVAYINGGSAGNHTVTGIKVGDTLFEVTEATVATGNITAFVDRTAEFTITAADTINNTGGTDTTGDKLIVRWYPKRDEQ